MVAKQTPQAPVSILLEFGHGEKPYRKYVVQLGKVVSILLEFGHGEKQRFFTVGY